MFNTYLLQAAGAAPQGSLLSMILPFALIFIVFYFFMIRPQNKKAKETQAMLDAMKKGDKVVTIGGIHGTINQVKEKTVIVKVDDGTKLEFNRSAIASVNNAEGIPVKKDSKKEKAAESVEEPKAEESAPAAETSEEK